MCLSFLSRTRFDVLSEDDQYDIPSRIEHEEEEDDE
jgi:hypothetical protein